MRGGARIKVQFDETDHVIGCVAAEHAARDPNLVPCRGERRWEIRIEIQERRRAGLAVPPVQRVIQSACDAHGMKAVVFLCGEVFSSDALRTSLGLPILRS